MSLGASPWFWKKKGRWVTEVDLVCLVEFVLLLPCTFIIWHLNYLGCINWLVSIWSLGVATRSWHNSWCIRAKFSIVLVVPCAVKPFLVNIHWSARRLLTMVAFRRVSRFVQVDCMLKWVKIRSEIVIQRLLVSMLAGLLTVITAFVGGAGQALYRLFIAFVKIVPQAGLHVSMCLAWIATIILSAALGLDRGSHLIWRLFRTCL